MRQVYRDLADPRRLVARERDVLTGRRTAAREDKGREDAGHRTSRPRPRTRAWAASAVAAVVLVGGGIVGARALLAPEDVALPTPTVSATSPAPTATPSPSVAPATAILLEYVGGEFVRRECSDATGEGACVYFPDDYTPLTVRCTVDGCTVYSLEVGPIDGPFRRSGSVPASEEECQPTRWTVDLEPVGEATTEGLRHPARIVGTVTVSRPAEVVGDFNCLGAVDEYRYDAVP